MSAAVSIEERPHERCANHPKFSPIAICSLCGRDICAHCHATTLTGYAICRSCPVADQLAPKTTWERATGFGHFHAFFHTSVAVLRNPRTFFSFIAAGGDWLKPTILGLICSVVGALFALTYQLAFVSSTAEILSQLTAELGLTESAAIAMLYLTVPWSAMLVYGVHLGLLGLSVQIAGSDTFNWPTVARIVAYASTAQLFMVIPPVMEFPLGHFLAIMWLFNLELTGVRQFFGLTFGRSILVVLPPFLFLTLFGA